MKSMSSFRLFAHEGDVPTKRMLIFRAFLICVRERRFCIQCLPINDLYFQCDFKVISIFIMCA